MTSFRTITTPLAISLLLIAGIGLRAYHLGAQSYWMDEGYTVNATLSIIAHGNEILDSGLPYHCPMYCYPSAWIAQHLGATPIAFRLLAVISGVVFIGALYAITRRLFDRRTAVLASAFVTFSYWQIAWSRQARWYTLFEIFFWLALYFFYQSIYSTRRRSLFICLTVVTTVLTSLTHGLGYLLPFIFLAWFIIDCVFIQRSISIKSLIASIASLGAALALLLLVRPGFMLAIFSRAHLSYELPYYLSFYLRTYWLFIPFIILVAVDTKKKEIWYLLLAFAAYLVPLSFLTSIVQYRYLFHLTPVFFILGAVGMIQIYDWISVRWQKWLFVGVVAALFFTIGGGVLIPRTNYWLESDNPQTLGSRPHYAYTPQPDWASAYDYVRTHQKTTDLIISSQPEFTKIYLNQPGYWIKYSYLGITQEAETIINDHEYYVGARVIDDLAELKSITTSTHGFIVLDFMALDGRISPDIQQYISQHLAQVFAKSTNPWSQIWVWQF